ncbi:putative holin-like toxin [Bacillus sp. SD088]
MNSLMLAFGTLIIAILSFHKKLKPPFEFWRF